MNQTGISLIAVLACGVAIASAQSIVINEVVTSNQHGLEDEDDDRPDWIELHNPGAAAINLAGYGLSDDDDEPFRWRLPSIRILAGGYLLIHASGKDRTNTAALHTNFRLSSAGEVVRLTRPDSQLIDRLAIPALPPDMAYGRRPDDPSRAGYLANPTPGTANRLPAGSSLLRPPALSHLAGWHPAPFLLTLTTPDPGAEIRYTLDGSEPGLASPRYTMPLLVTDRSGEPNGISLIEGTSTRNQHTDGWKPPLGQVRKLTVVRASAFRADALVGGPVTRSFAVGPATNAGLPVVSLTLPPTDLFDYETGIYMLGRVFDDWRRAHPNEPLTGHTPANYTQRGDAWERRASMEFFSSDGRGAFESPIRLDIQGQSTRSFRQKPLGIKTQFDPITHEIFPGLSRRGDGRPLVEFERLRLRNSGNDWTHSLFRDALCHRLSDGLGIDTQAYRPVQVFLNGEYWGIHNLREQHDPAALASHYGMRKSDVVICSADGGLLDGAAGANQPFLDLLEYVRTHSLADPAHFAHVAQRIDVSNFIRYHAACVYLGNADWPHNNLRVWRDRAGPTDGGPVQPRDGRWRWLLFDCDLAYAHPWSGGVSDPTLATLLSPVGHPGLGGDYGWSTLLFRGLMANPGFRRDFINASADLLNSWFKENRAIAQIDAMRSALAPAIPEHLARWQTHASFAAWTNEVRVLSSFARQRPIIVRQHVVQQLGLAGYAPLTLDVVTPEGGRVRVNQLRIGTDLPGVEGALYPWRGWYFRDVPIELEATAQPGWRFVRWQLKTDAQSATNRDPLIPLTLTDPTTAIAVFEPVPLQFGSTVRQSSGTVVVQVSGLPGQRVRVEGSADLTAWSELTILALDAAGAGQLVLDPGPHGRHYFLRLASGASRGSEP